MTKLKFLVCSFYSVSMSIITGYAGLTARSSIQPFICEICNPSIRETTSALYALFLNSGEGLSILACKFFGWRYVSGFYAILMAFLIVLLTQLHETPDWLLGKGQYERVVKTLEFYKVDPLSLLQDPEKTSSSK